MFRIVALCWDRKSEPRGEAASAMLARFDSRWVRAFSAEGLRVLHTGERPASSRALLLGTRHGIVLGTLFSSSSSRTIPPGAFDEPQAREIVESRGQTLVTRYWGRYVALLHEPASGTSWLLRDPVAAFPCFLAEIAGVRVIFSDIRDVMRLPGTSWSINWRYVAAKAAGGVIAKSTQETGLIGVQRAPPGECIELSRRSMSGHRLWDPARIAASLIEDENEAEQAIHVAARQSIWAWASCYERIIHLLSGGFDSSAVLSCLASAPSRPELVCLNYFSATLESDERELARLAANYFGVELLEAEKRAAAVRLESVLTVRRTAAPASYLYYLEHSAQQGALASERRSEAIFSGVGGDQIFFQASLPLAAADLLHRKGLGRTFLRYCLDIARVQGGSMWYVVKEARGAGRHPGAVNDPGMQRRLIRTGVAESALSDEALTGNLVSARSAVGAGKQRHIRTMDLGHEFYDPLGGDDYPERTRPLISQPLVETCLRIPTYVLAARGIDRCSARRAFGRDLPAPIVRRQTKGAIDSHITEIFRANTPFLRELMLDGVLVRERILDRALVERTLSRPEGGFGREAAELLNTHFSIEAWARSWAA